MNQSPTSIDSSGQEGGIFVVWRHDDAKPFVGAEISSKCEGYARAATRIGSVGHSILIEFRHIRDARILNAPHFFGKPLWLGGERGSGIYLPPIDAVFGASRAQVRKAAAIFHAAKQKSGSIGQ